MKKIYCVLYLICMFVVAFIGVSFAENEVLVPQVKVTEEQFQDCLRKAQAGDPFEQFIVGTLFLNGNGCVQNDIKGILWLTKAAQQGQKEAAEMMDICQPCVNPANAMRLASIYYDGIGVPQDFKLSAMWARRGEPLSCVFLKDKYCLARCARW